MDKNLNVHIETEELNFSPVNFIFHNLLQKWNRNRLDKYQYLQVLDKIGKMFQERSIGTEEQKPPMEIILDGAQCETLLNEIEEVTCMNRRNMGLPIQRESVQCIEFVREELDQFIRYCLKAYNLNCLFKLKFVET